MQVKNILSLFLLLFISFHSVSQDKAIDSLKLELNKNISEKERTNILHELCLKTRVNNPEKAKTYANRAIEIAIANSFNKEEAIGYSDIAISYSFLQDYGKAIEFLNKSTVIAEKIDDKNLIANNYLTLGIIHFLKYDYFNSFYNYDKALKLYREDDNIPLVATCLTNISIIYFKTKDYEKALKYTLECNAVLKDNTKELADSFQVTAECYSKLQQTKLAKSYANKSIVIYEKQNNDFERSISYIVLGDAYSEEEQYIKAYNIYNSISKTIESSGNKYLKMTYYFGLSKVLNKLKRYDESLLQARKSFNIANELKDNEIIFETSKIIAEVSGELKNYDDLKSFYKIHLKYKDSLLGDEFYRGKFEHELKESVYRNKKEKEQIAYKNKKEKEIEASKRKNLLLLVVTGFLILLTVFGLYFYRKQNKLYQEANAGNKAKSVFLSKVTHEIKTPITSIIGFSNLLKDSSLSKEQVLEYNNNIAISSNRLLKLSNEILEVSSLKEGKNNFLNTPQNINILLNTVKEYYTIEAKQKGLTFKVEYSLFDTHLFYDNNKLTQIIDNILINAIKFTDFGKIFFKIDIESENEQEAYINFIIKDTGIGISKDHIKKIQKEFYQIINNEADNVGVGLGLSIVKKNLDLMNSKLEIVSKLDHGSIFSFKLKLEKGALLKKDGIVKEKDKVSFSKTLKILIAEDNKLSSLLIKKILESFFDNIQLFFAYDGLEAIKFYLEEKPNIIIMDLQMPNLDGFESAKSIRELQEEHIPIIACSATLIGDNIQKCNVHGIDDYIEKPINKELLKSTLLKHIKIPKKQTIS